MVLTVNSKTKHRTVDKAIRYVAETDQARELDLTKRSQAAFAKCFRARDAQRIAISHQLACDRLGLLGEKAVLDGNADGWTAIDRAFIAQVVDRLTVAPEFRICGRYPESSLLLHAASIGMSRMVDALRHLITSDIAAGVFDGPYPQDVWQLPHFALWCIDGGEPGPMRSPHREIANALIAGSEDSIRPAVKEAAEWHVQHGRERGESMEAEFEEHTLMPVEFWVLAGRRPEWAKFFTPDVHPLFATPFATRPPSTYDPSQDKELLQVLELTGLEPLW